MKDGRRVNGGMAASACGASASRAARGNQREHAPPGKRHADVAISLHCWNSTRLPHKTPRYENLCCASRCTIASARGIGVVRRAALSSW